MSGLPCDVCQEDQTIVLNGEAGLDGDDALTYRRYRVCTNPRCERYLHRRTTAEVYLPDVGEPRIFRPEEMRRILRAMPTYQPPGDSDGLPMLPWQELS